MWINCYFHNFNNELKFVILIIWLAGLAVIPNPNPNPNRWQQGETKTNNNLTYSLLHQHIVKVYYHMWPPPDYRTIIIKATTESFRVLTGLKNDGSINIINYLFNAQKTSRIRHRLIHIFKKKSFSWFNKVIKFADFGLLAC